MMLKLLKNLLLIMGCALLLSACSLFSPVSSQQTTYVLNTKSYIPSAVPTNLTIAVELPQANQAYNTDSMAYIPCPYQIAYFAKNHWVDTPPQMLLPLIVQSLQSTGHYHAVVAAPYSGYSDITLDTELIALHQDFLEKPSQERVVLRAVLINTATQHVIATREFNIHVCAPRDTPQGGVIAANTAVANLIAQLTEFCVNAE